MAVKIEVNYEDLENLGSRFNQDLDCWQQYVQLLKTRLTHVYATWEGKGADTFEHEMENLVLPAVQRLSQALHTGQETCQKIGQTFHDCEEEAGSLFRTDDGGGAIPVIIRKRTILSGREQGINPGVPGITSDNDTHEAVGVGLSGGAGAGIGMGASAGAGTGISGGAGAGIGMGASAGAGAGLSGGGGAGVSDPWDGSTTSGAGLSGGAGAGIGMGASAGAGAGISGGAGAGIGMSASAGAGAGISGGAGAGIGTGASAGAGAGISGGAGAGIGTGASAGAGAGLSGGAGAGIGLGASAGAGAGISGGAGAGIGADGINNLRNKEQDFNQQYVELQEKMGQENRQSGPAANVVISGEDTEKNSISNIR